MAGNWIKMGTDLRTHPRVVRIASALKADGRPDTLRAVGALHALWCIFDAHSENGTLRGYTPELADDMIGWPGFTDAVIAAGWATFDGESLALPNFDAHNGQSAKRRAMEADRKKDARKASASNADKVRTRIEKEEIVETPHSPPAGGEVATEPKPARERKITFASWIERLAKTGEKAVAGDDPVFEFARNAGIPPNFVKIAWHAFRAYHLDRPDKKQLDWRAVFRNYVRENYQRLWRTTDAGGYELTDKGVQAQRAMEGGGNGAA